MPWIGGSSFFSAAILIAFALGGARSAIADWLDDAWSDDSVQINGNPAITISGDVIHVTLPAATLRQAHQQGLSTKEALVAFIDRYGQRCSHLLNLNLPHPGLKVALSLQVPSTLDVASGEAKELEALTRAYLKQHEEIDLPLLFLVSPGEVEYSIDYVPMRRVRCVAPTDDEGPTS
jgi:hypothetical protein